MSELMELRKIVITAGSDYFDTESEFEEAVTAMLPANVRQVRVAAKLLKCCPECRGEHGFTAEVNGEVPVWTRVYLNINNENGEITHADTDTGEAGSFSNPDIAISCDGCGDKVDADWFERTFNVAPSDIETTADQWT